MSTSPGNSLFERLRKAAGVAPDSTPGSTTTSDLGIQFESVLANLERLFNTREGSAPAQADLGIPAPTEIAFEYPDSIDKVRRKLASTIKRYEPRLQRAQVSYVEKEDDKLHLHFRISGRLALAPYGPSVTFAVVVGASGDVLVKRPERSGQSPN